jgi:alkyldihydroxyacetonephosphate synthase
LWRAGIVVDTVEVSARWSALPGLYRSVLDALGGMEGTLAASSHQSHAYTDGACLYFTFAGRSPSAEDPGSGDDPEARAWIDQYYRRAWDEVTRATMAAGGAISHHHGVGINRSRFLPSALGAGFGVLAAVKQALDPKGILNPGKLGLDSPYGPAPWP